MRKIEIWTDGAALPTNPGQGGWAYLIKENGLEIKRESAGYSFSTNNRMEIMGVLFALQWVLDMDNFEQLRNEAKIVVYSDSTYVVNGFNDWCNDWVRKNSNKTNMDLWRQIVEIKKQVPARLVWVRGHAGNECNEICDRLANTAAQTHNKQMYRDEEYMKVHAAKMAEKQNDMY